MYKSWITGVALTLLSVSGVVAQDAKEVRKVRKEAAVVKAQKAVDVDKADLNTLRERKSNDKYNYDKQGVKADRKAIRKTDKRLVKDRVKRDVAKVKKVL
jgi:hypothetical protein